MNLCKAYLFYILMCVVTFWAAAIAVFIGVTT